MQIISGSNSTILAQQLAKATNIQLLKTSISNFADGELRVKIIDQINSEDVLIIQSTSVPANDNLMELLLLTDTAKRAGAKNVTAIVPYLCYTRQDRIKQQSNIASNLPQTYFAEPLSISLVARMFESAGINKLITLDLHSKQIEDYFNIPVVNLSSYILFQGVVKNISDKGNAVIISPDSGGRKRALEFSSKLSADFAFIDKYRDDNNRCWMNNICGASVEGADCIIIDDIADTGGTIIKAAKILYEQGAKTVTACVTHPVLSGDAKSDLQNSVIEKIYISDSIGQQNFLADKFEVIPIYKSLSSLIDNKT